MDITTHPNPQPNPHHRKIDLQSPADLLYLQRNLSAAATAKLNLHFPPKHAYATHIPLDGNPNTSTQSTDTPEQVTDPLRTRVEELVTTFLRETWSGAKHSVSVNGLDANEIPDLFAPPPPTSTSTPTANGNHATPEIEGIHFTYTPYDPRLSTKLSTLYSELESLTSIVSNLRRTTPRTGAEAYLTTLSSTLSADDTTHTIKMEDAQHPPSQNLLNTQKLQTDDTPTLYDRGLNELAGLSGLQQASSNSKTQTRTAEAESAEMGAGGSRKRKQGNPTSLTETVGKVQRARRVVGELLE